MKQRYQKRQYTNPESVNFFVEQGVPLCIAQALNARGVTSDTLNLYLGDNLFHSPFEMKNMQEVVETVSYVLEGGGSVLICGDYDTDGVTASSILSLFFTDNGVDNDVIIPTRAQGYGLHADMVISAFQKKFYDLVITVDCGISNKNEVQKIIDELGAEIIVTDHHELPDELPDCLCLNPKMGYPFPYLAGAGVAWKLVEALAGREVAARYSALAAIGTIGDIMPLYDENRSLVQLGLANWNHKGLKKLSELVRCSEVPTANEIAMRISPKINAAGRVGNPYVALDLLLCRDKSNEQLANKLLEMNDERRQLVDDLIADADSMCDINQINDRRLVFLCDDRWALGVLGIVAAHYKDKYGYPALIITKNEQKGVYVGSARSVDNVDLFALFCNCKDLVVFGGHRASVGFSVKPENLEKLRDRLSEQLRHMDESCFETNLTYDVDLADCDDIVAAYEFLQKMQPIVPQDKITFFVKDTVKMASTFGKDNQHLSMTLSSGLEVKRFFANADYAPFIKNGADIEALITLDYDSFNKKVFGVLNDIRLCNSVCFDSFYRLNFLKNFQPKDVEYCSRVEVEKLLKCSSVLAVFDDYETFLEQSKEFDFSNFYVDIFFDNSIFQSTVAVSPNADYDFSKYRYLLCFARNGMVRDIPNAKYFLVQPANEQLYNVSLTRDICAAVFSRLKYKSKFESLHGVHDKYLMGKMSYEQYMLSLRVFEELKFIQIVDKYTVNFLPAEKADLTMSAIFRCFA